jgi:hypothetical protein
MALISNALFHRNSIWWRKVRVRSIYRGLGMLDLILYQIDRVVSALVNRI